MRVLAMVFHNCVVHPLMGFFILISWGHWMPRWLERLHDGGPFHAEEEEEDHK